jgi:hypothetical protein
MKTLVLSFNFSMSTIDAMKAHIQQAGARFWINHDMEQNAKIAKASAFVQ